MPFLKCHSGLLLATLGFCWTQRLSHSGELSRARFVAGWVLGILTHHCPWDLPQVPHSTPSEQDGVASTILCWAQTVLQTRHQGLGEPKASAAWSSPSLGRHLPGALLHLAPCLGRARASKKQFRLVQRTRVGLLWLFML